MPASPDELTPALESSSSRGDKRDTEIGRRVSGSFTPGARLQLGRNIVIGLSSCTVAEFAIDMFGGPPKRELGDVEDPVKGERSKQWQAPLERTLTKKPR